MFSPAILPFVFDVEFEGISYDLQLYTRSEYGVPFNLICLKQFEH